MTVPEPATLTSSPKRRVKLAPTFCAAVMDSVHVGPVLDWHAPVQPLNVLPPAAVAVSVTLVPSAKSALHVAPHATPAGALVTVPSPVPERLTASARMGGGEPRRVGGRGVAVGVGCGVSVARVTGATGVRVAVAVGLASGVLVEVAVGVALTVAVGTVDGATVADMVAVTSLSTLPMRAGATVVLPGPGGVAGGAASGAGVAGGGVGVGSTVCSGTAVGDSVGVATSAVGVTTCVEATETTAAGTTAVGIGVATTAAVGVGVALTAAPASGAFGGGPTTCWPATSGLALTRIVNGSEEVRSVASNQAVLAGVTPVRAGAPLVSRLSVCCPACSGSRTSRSACQIGLCRSGAATWCWNSTWLAEAEARW